MFHGRSAHYSLLIALWAMLCLVNLGGPSLWDIDEGNNAECAREMYEADNWIVPTFNFATRVDKPALLYWMQMTGYHVFGIGEFAARLPSALAALACVLLTYELGRRMFGTAAGLLSGVVLSVTILFCAAAHFANPDTLLCACTLLTMFLFWQDQEGGRRRWLLLCGLSTGLGMLAKGPVALVLPAAVICLFLLWTRQLGRLFDRRLIGGMLLFLLVAAPWYGWVGADTRGEFLRGFFLRHNVDRFLAPMENHRGPILYYPLVLIVGFAPWSIFFALLVRQCWCDIRARTHDDRLRFLLCWVGVYLVFFSVSRTKLPNYILPLYPPLAVLLGSFLDRWRKREIVMPRWGIPTAIAGLVVAGGATVLGFLTAGGALAPSLTRGRHLPGMELWAVLGLVPIAGALAVWWYQRTDRRTASLAALGVAGAVWLGASAAWAVGPVDRSKAPRELGEILEEHSSEEFRIGWFEYNQPSLVFYCRQRIEMLADDGQAIDWLRHPVPTYAVMPAASWERLKPRATSSREIGRRRDLYRGVDVVLVSNR